MRNTDHHRHMDSILKEICEYNFSSRVHILMVSRLTVCWTDLNKQTSIYPLFLAVSSSSSGPITSHGEPIVSVMYSSSILSHYPVSIQCPSCEKQVVTRVEYESGAGTWLISLVICIFGGFLGCCLIPFCISSCQDAVHHCPACSNYIGRRNLM